MVRICSVLIMLLVNVTVFSQYITKGGELITIIDEAPIFKKKLDKNGQHRIAWLLLLKII